MAEDVSSRYLQVQNHGNYTVPQIPCNCNGPIQRPRMQRLHTECSCVLLTHGISMQCSHAKTKQRLHAAEALLSAGRDFEHVIFL